LDRRLGGPQSRSGRGGEEKNSQPPPGMGRLKIHARIYLKKPEGKRLIRRSWRKWKDNIIVDLKETGCRMDSTNSEQGPLVVSCEHCNEPSGSVKRGELFDCLIDYQSLKDCVPWN
jgi:hypothetical protein